MKPEKLGLIAAISTLFFALLSIPAISNSDNSDITTTSLTPSASPTHSSSESPRTSTTHSIEPSPSSVPDKIETASPSTPQPDPTIDRDEVFEIPKEFIKQLLGMKEADAKVLIWANNYLSRVVHRDGEDFMVTADYRYNRINLYINGGIVTDATVG